MRTVSQLSKSFAGRALFDDVSLQVNRGDRLCESGPVSFALVGELLSLQ
jgi:ATPase subunit of ABC transporter with duplicated ATPase domains